MVSVMADIVDDFLQRLAAHVPADVASQVAPKLEAEIRQHWGGTDRHYIRKHAKGAIPAHLRAQQRTQALATGLQQGQPLADLFQQAGIPRRTGFRLLQRKAR